MANTGCRWVATSTWCRARPRSSPICKARWKRQSHEPLRTLYSAPHCDGPAYGWLASLRAGRLPGAARRAASSRPLPNQITAELPGADPEKMASSEATPLEQQLIQVPGVAQLTSSSALGYTQLT